MFAASSRMANRVHVSQAKALFGVRRMPVAARFAHARAHAGPVSTIKPHLYLQRRIRTQCAQCKPTPNFWPVVFFFLRVQTCSVFLWVFFLFVLVFFSLHPEHGCWVHDVHDHPCDGRAQMDSMPLTRRRSKVCVFSVCTTLECTSERTH